MSVQEFFHMGGYGGFVWTSYGLTTLVLVLNWISARRSESEQRGLAMRRLTIDQEGRT